MAKGSGIKIDVETILIGSALAVGAFIMYKHVIEPNIPQIKEFFKFEDKDGKKLDHKQMMLRLAGGSPDIEDPVKRKKLLAEIDKVYKNHPQVPKVLPEFLKREIKNAADFMEKHPHLINHNTGFNTPTAIGLSSI